MFRFTQEPSSGSYKQSLAKLTSLVQLCESVQTLSVVWRYIVTCVCVYCSLCKEVQYFFAQWTIRTHTRSEYAAITLTTTVPTRTAEQVL